MTLSDRSSLSGLLLLAVYLLATPALAKPATESECRPLVSVDSDAGKPMAYSDALLWKVRKNNKDPSYIFGTIHVSDPDIVNLPRVVSEYLDAADLFVMEALPTPEEALAMSQEMYFTDDRTLQDYIGESLFERTVHALGEHQVPAESVKFMKPWAAFLLMSYPPADGLRLDLALLEKARGNGIKVAGLESLKEQSDVFSSLDMELQVRFLLDTVCNYDEVKKDFETIKKHYRKRNLDKLYLHANKYSISGEKIYRDLVKKLLTDRNRIMTSRMQEMLEQGNAFIAIGAMHLPGNDGVLSLLAGQGYTITSVY
ncbi:MAG TPA: TraB/GumN family protein [Gammaproteobacteria bacterium]|nr:TraB/GumN family protein [Gammaproteobacteria bacterium]